MRIKEIKVRRIGGIRDKRRKGIGKIRNEEEK